MDKNNNYRKHAEQEFKALGWADSKDEWQDEICEQVCELLDLFATHGHSGSTAPYAVNLFSKLALFKPLGPLTGEDHEWDEFSPGKFQNKRCSHVFKQSDRFDGKAYDINGKVFREPNGSTFTSSESFTVVDFPYTPKTEYVDVTKEDVSAN